MREKQIATLRAIDNELTDQRLRNARRVET